MLTLPLNEIDKQEALRYMGCPGAPDASLLAVVSDCCDVLFCRAWSTGCCRSAGKTAFSLPAAWCLPEKISHGIWQSATGSF